MDAATRDLLAAVLEALDIPHPATASGAEVHDRILADRAIPARVALRAIVDKLPPTSCGPDWYAKWLRDSLAKHPVTGYVTADQAQAALDAGKTWSEAVQLPEGEGR
ncbi:MULTISPECIES: hypothetical protein [unclassified Streptomyces]|uniref:hypothetical protein n=1 Tax=unclassified Streptomyces TaxID=2593676 RepID=UPI0036F4F9B3